MKKNIPIYVMLFFLLLNGDSEAQKRLFIIDTIYNYESGIMFYDSLNQTFFKCDTNECSFNDGIINGTLRRFDNNGRILSLYNLKNGFRFGYNYDYYSDGTVFRKVFFNNDTLNGEYIEYFRNGNISINYTMYNGVYDGNYIKFDEDGDTIVFNQYKYGKDDGKYIAYYKNGNRKFVLVNKDGVVIDKLSYNRRGKLKRKKY